MLIPTSWLFVKGEESVWIYRPTASDLLICGRRTERFRCGFANEKRGSSRIKLILPRIPSPQAGSRLVKAMIGAAGVGAARPRYLLMPFDRRVRRRDDARGGSGARRT